jgi:streptogramin lyase
MSDPVGVRFPRWIGTIATAAMAATAIVFNPLAAGAAATVIAEFPTPTAGSTPQGITVGSDGNLWFTEFTGGNRIGQSTPAGAITEFTGLTGAPFWITSGPDGNLWITESSASAIGVLSTAGAVVGEFPVPTAGSLPDQIAPGPDGNMWFTEYVGNQIGRITPAGVITEFPIPSAGAGPTAIVAGSDGNLWFAEQAGNRIGRITTKGAVTEFGPVGSLPAGMAAGPDGNVWFTEFNGNQIGRITMAGVITEYAVTTAGSEPASIAAGPDGNLWFTEYAGNKIGRMSPAGEMLAEFALPTAGSGPNAITTGPDGNLWFTEPLTSQIGRLTPGTAVAPTALTYDGATTGDFNDPATVSATLADTSTTPATPLSGQSMAFTLNGAETCSGVTDALGRATCQLTPGETSGTYAVVANFAGSALLKASSTSASFAVTVEETTLALVAPALIANGSSVSLSAVLTEDGTRPIAGRTVTLGLGTGASAQQCTATTNAAGAATCSIDTVNQPLGAGGVFATFAGDGFYAPASAGGAFVAFAFLTGGMFVVGDGSAHVGGSVTFWSSTWSDSNTMSGGPGPSSFKGFASTMTPAPACGDTWTSTTGNSSSPPAGPLPAYMAIVVTSSVDKSGSTVTGNITRIVIVKTDPGYTSNPSGTGTGTVVGVLCSA